MSARAGGVPFLLCLAGLFLLAGPCSAQDGNESFDSASSAVAGLLKDAGKTRQDRESRKSPDPRAICRAMIAALLHSPSAFAQDAQPTGQKRVERESEEPAPQLVLLD
ncbi:MAG: hypothetical protein AAB322_09385, partial [Pseudomonadota bacterium]